MIQVRQLIAWYDRARNNELPAMAVGGVPIEDFRPGVPTCPEPLCGLTGDAETVLLHAFEEHGRDRRQNDRRRVGRAA